MTPTLETPSTGPIPRRSLRKRGVQVNYQLDEEAPNGGQIKKRRCEKSQQITPPVTPLGQQPLPDQSLSKTTLHSWISSSGSHIEGHPDSIRQFRESFPNGCEKIDVSAEGLLCGLRALRTSILAQHGEPAPSVEELHDLAQSDQMLAAELDLLQDVPRPLNKAYYADQLAKLLRIWCQKSNPDFVLGWLLSNGQVTVYDDDDTVATTGIVWIFSTSTTGKELYGCLDHYQGLRRRSGSPLPISDDDYDPAEDDVDSDDEDCFNSLIDPENDLELDSDPDDGVSTESGRDDPELGKASSDRRRVSRLKAPYCDENGLIRVGRQPFLRHSEEIRSIPRHLMRKLLSTKVAMNISRTDKKMHPATATDEETTQHKTQLFQYLDTTFSTHDLSDGYVKRYCDYTGLELLWTPGPFSASLEAICPFAISNGEIAYHTNSNSGLVLSCLNFAKRRHPLLVLPLAAVWLNAHDLKDFEEEKAVKSWALNSACNMSLLGQLIGCWDNHLVQKSRWSGQSTNELREILDTIRTGSMNDSIRERLESLGDYSPFRLTRHVTPIHSKIECGDLPQNGYKTAVKIAARYSVTAEEFDRYCCINSAGADGCRMFYPFHVLSRPQAEADGWDWISLCLLAREKLEILRRGCNRRAEDAGYGEKDMDHIRLVYWLVHWVCRKIHVLKQDSELVERDQIAWHLFEDRFAFPIVPWTRHVWTVSFCKQQDVSELLK